MATMRRRRWERRGCARPSALVWSKGDEGGRFAAPRVGKSMSRVIAAMACGLSLAACSMSMPSFDFFKSSPATEQLRIESEPPGADARTSQGQTCRTPCELTVPSGGDLAVTVALNGYQPQTVPVRPESPEGPRDRESDVTSSSARLQPNPVYVELQPAGPGRPGKKAAPKKKTTAAVRPARPTGPPEQTQGAAPASTPANPSAGQGYPWPPAPQ
jgi:PEGA domain-containing protein